MKRVMGFLVMGGVALACGGTSIDPLLDGGGGETGKDSSEPFACGTSTCDGDQICIHPCCGGAAPVCEPLEDGGTCPSGYVLSTQCYNLGGSTTGCQAPPCTPPPPYCAPSSSSNMCGFQQTGHDCYEACA
jgi:hypothetical protein